MSSISNINWNSTNDPFNPKQRSHNANVLSVANEILCPIKYCNIEILLELTQHRQSQTNFISYHIHIMSSHYTSSSKYHCKYHP